MTDSSATVRRSPSHEARPYRDRSLAEVIARIVRQSDQTALDELHQYRTVFRTSNNGPLRLAEFVSALCRCPWAWRLAGGREAVLDATYDLTIDRFSHLPAGPDEATAVKSPGPDCRQYLGVVLTWMDAWRHEHPKAEALEEEGATAETLQRQVVRHFALSCQEAKRNANPAMSRYAWQVDGKMIRVCMPISLSGPQRRDWLEANVNDPDPDRPGERRRIQAIIDAQLPVCRQIPLDRAETQVSAAREDAQSPCSRLMSREISVRGLAQAVANEKAENLHHQRPAIQALGPSRLRRLILDIFEDLSQDCYDAQRLAATFGLSKATLSRFAGSRWSGRQSMPIPDLWANTAQTLAGHEPFVEAAKASGVWPTVCDISGGDVAAANSGGRHD